MIKMCDKDQGASLPAAHLPNIAHLLGCLLILPLHYVAFDDVIMQ